MISVILFYFLLIIFVKFILFVCLFIAFFCTCPLCFWAASFSQKMGGISRDQNDVSVIVSYLNFQIKWSNFYYSLLERYGNAAVSAPPHI